MKIVLNMRHAPSGAPLDHREVDGGTFRIGRSAECNWILADPEKVLSKCHCRLVENEGRWLVFDTSSNGTMLNGKALDPAVPKVLRDGDVLALGSYKLEVGATDHMDEPADRHSIRPRPSTEDPFPFPGTDEFGFLLPQVADLRSSFEPIWIDAFPEPTELGADRASNLYEHIRLPRPTTELLPEDWDTPPPSGSFTSQPTAGADQAPVQAPQAPSPLRTDVSVPTIGVPGPVFAPAGPHPGNRDAASGFAAFVEGAGLRGATVDDPAAALRALGEAFRALVSELRKTMMARATVKSEFRIEQTMIRPTGNNPLKFAVDDADALSALLGTGRRSGMSPRRAVADALRDLRLHELAVTAAMQQAVRDMLEEFAPPRIDAEVAPVALDSVTGRRNARLWRAFQVRHERLSHALRDDFDSAFGKSFVRAYEAAHRQADELDAADGEGGGEPK